MKASKVQLTYIDADGSETVLTFEPHQERELINALNNLFTEHSITIVNRHSKHIASGSGYTFIRGRENGRG